VFQRIRWSSPWIPLGLFPLALAYRWVWSTMVPPGRNHDAAENAVAAIQMWGGGADLLFIRGRGLEKEPLFQALLSGAMTFLEGEQALLWVSLLLGSAAAPAAWVLARAAGLRGGALVCTAWVTCGAWPVLYSLAGMRVVAALALSAVGLAGALAIERCWREQRGPSIRLLVGTGVALTLPLYAYTSARIVCAAAIAWLAVLAAARRPAGAARQGAWIGLGLLPAVPWIAALAGPAGREILLRGSYIFLADGADRWRLLLDSALLPFHVGWEYAPVSRPGFIADGAATVFPLAGTPPVALPFAALLAAGLVVGAVDTVRRSRAAAPSLAMAVWGAHLLILGFAGPSATRMLLAVPALALLMGWGAERLSGWLGGSRVAVTLAACATLAAAGGAWESARLARLVDHPLAWSNFPDAVAVAADLGVDMPADRTPVVVIPRARSVVELAQRRRPDMEIAEFYEAPGRLDDIAALPAGARPVYLVVRHPNTEAILADLAARHPTGLWTPVPGPGGRTFDELTLHLFDPEGELP
jgi:hypothetical protein